MMNKRFVLTILLAVFSTMYGIAQEYLSGFNGGIPDQKPLKSRDGEALTLPFFDDFSTDEMYPDATKWEQGNVYVSSTFAKMPVNYGAATFDIIDRNGKVYTRGSTNQFIGDTLLSLRIRLDSLDNQALTPADSVYFSFYYQPGGFGDSPERDDSLVLKFGYGDHWTLVWAAEGQDFQAFTDSLGENMYFKKVMIPIIDTCFFKDDFRVLFYNYGSLPSTMYPNDRSNMDQWNIDFVYLDKNRSMVDDSYPLVSLTHNSPTFLKRYQSMPYKHYLDNPINEIDNIFNMYLTNLDEHAHEVRYSCEVEDNNSGWSYSFINNPLVVNQYANVGVVKDSVVMGDFIYPYNVSVDTTSFTVRHNVELIDGTGDVVSGDSFEHRQVFGNYFAYDDGTPESGYGLVPNDTYFAVQFKVTKLDTVSGVQMLFNRTYNDANFNFFDIVVWKDNNGRPGQVIYTLKDQRPIWDDDGLYKFSTYMFKKVVKVNSTFYVGIRQQYSKSINIGFDSSLDKSRYNFYDAGEGWKQSSFKGAIMLRPIMGRNPGLQINEGGSNDDAIELYPIPARDVLRIESTEESGFREIIIFDLTGRLVKQYPYSNELNINDLEDGVYLLRAVKNNGAYKTTKLLISK